MRRSSKLSLALAAAALLGVFAAHASVTRSLLEDGAHCVAYRVKKSAFFISSSYVVGRNCDISAQVLPEVGGLYHIEVNVPVRAFQSGDSDRDKDVTKILRVDQRAEITFRTKARSVDEWRAIFAQGRFELEGRLRIGDGDYELKVPMTYAARPEGHEVDGVVAVKFADFGLTPPKILGGVVTRARSDFELHFHLVAQRILGADTIRLPDEPAAAPKQEAE